jgi:FtsP/CotA-like multicopper oxidase with cupredoxin domain
VESFYDGVADWSGSAGHTAPRVEPGDSFVVRLTPDRAGTFIYHTHQDEGVQLASGLYGPLIVLAPGAAYDSSTDHVLLIGRGGASAEAPVLLNGTTTPAPMEWSVGTTHRLRFINITANDVEEVTLLRDSTVQQWRPFAKDGAEVAGAQATPRPARVRMGPGETYDFELTPGAPSDLTLLAVVRGRAGRTWEIRVAMRVR